MNHNPLIIALDNLSFDQAESLMEKLAGHVWGFKFNDMLFHPSIRELLDTFAGRTRFMIDAKLHDIPNTMANQVRRLRDLSPSIITAHASAGIDGLKAANDALREGVPEDAEWPRLAAVTVLTSLDERACDRIYGMHPNNTVQRLGDLAAEAGAEAIVCSGHELRHFTKLVNYTMIVPGIRPEWYQPDDDQKRTMTPATAIEKGATHLVMGRPIIKADDPVAAAERTIREIEAASFLTFAWEKSALKFGDFELKSGRHSPYFFNTGVFAEIGTWSRRLGEFYAKMVQRRVKNPTLVVGPAYKGIPLAVSTAETLGLPYAFDRKEEKAHGDGGTWVGHTPTSNDNVVIVDDVITDGATKREIVEKVRATGAKVAAIIVAFDRQEKGTSGVSAVEELQEATGVPVYSLGNAREMEPFVSNLGGIVSAETLDKLRAYREEYGA